jgi:hypothetical protein
MSVEVSRPNRAANAPSLALMRAAKANAALGSFLVGGLVLVMIFLQKFVFPFTSTIAINIPVIAVYGVVAVMVVRLQFQIAPARMAAFALLFTGIFISQIMAVGEPSTLSLLQFLILYFPLVFVWPVTEERYLSILGVFQNAMLVVGAMVGIQLLSQVIFGMGTTPDIELYVPRQFLLPGYNYHSQIQWGNPFIRPDGFFFLEPSFVSSFLACALVTELMFFHRLWRTAFYAAALLGCVAATGLLLLALAVPFLIPRQTPRMLAAAGLIAAIALVGAGGAGVLNSMFSRISELGTPGSSGFERLVAPLVKLNELWADPRFVIAGAGAGGNAEGGTSTWPVVKVMVEYGVVTGIAFMALLVACAIRAPNRAVAFAFFIVFNFTGGFLATPVSVIQFWLLLALMQPERPRDGISLLSAEAHKASGARRARQPRQRRADVAA